MLKEIRDHLKNMTQRSNVIPDKYRAVFTALYDLPNSTNCKLPELTYEDLDELCNIIQHIPEDYRKYLFLYGTTMSTTNDLYLNRNAVMDTQQCIINAKGVEDSCFFL